MVESEENLDAKTKSDKKSSNFWFLVDKFR